jgi:predicted RNase H-like nuclease (RuvC/YqgF family)
MATITQLEQDNSNLNAINDDITDIISYLNSSVSELSSLSRNIETRYTVDDNSTPIIDRIKKLKEEFEAYKASKE